MSVECIFDIHHIVAMKMDTMRETVLDAVYRSDEAFVGELQHHTPLQAQYEIRFSAPHIAGTLAISFQQSTELMTRA